MTARPLDQTDDHTSSREPAGMTQQAVRSSRSEGSFGVELCLKQFEGTGELTSRATPAPLWFWRVVFLGTS
jgi:hypothetical protein